MRHRGVDHRSPHPRRALEPGTLTQQVLATSLRLEQSTVGKLVDQLEAQDRVTRNPNPDDGRSRLVSLTRNGRRRAERLNQARSNFFSQLLSTVTPTERRTIAQALTILERAAHEID